MGATFLAADAIATLSTLDYVGIFGGVVAAILAVKTLLTTFEWAGQKLGIKFKWVEEKRLDHELLQKTVESMSKLETRLSEDERKSEEEDNALKDEMQDLKKDIEDLAIVSKDILEKVGDISSSNELQKQAITEVLYDVIDKQCDKYINELNGIPSSEISWFTDRFKLYDKNGGNHGLKHKVNYCLEKLPIIPD